MSKSIFIDLSNFPFTTSTTFMLDYGTKALAEDGDDFTVTYSVDVVWQFRNDGFYDSEDREGCYQLNFNL